MFSVLFLLGCNFMLSSLYAIYVLSTHRDLTSDSECIGKTFFPYKYERHGDGGNGTGPRRSIHPSVLFDADSDQPFGLEREREVTSIAVNSSCEIVALGGKDSVIATFDLSTGAPKHTIPRHATATAKMVMCAMVTESTSCTVRNISPKIRGDGV